MSGAISGGIAAGPGFWNRVAGVSIGGLVGFGTGLLYTPTVAGQAAAYTIGALNTLTFGLLDVGLPVASAINTVALAGVTGEAGTVATNVAL